MNDLLEYLAAGRERFEDELCELLRLRSVSADPRYLEAISHTAGWVADRFRQLGLSAEIVATEGHPLVYAESADVAGAPTVLIYGHYDVQPPDPLDLWESAPFDPTRRDGYLYARGATDDKGQFYTHLKSAEAWLRTRGHLPVKLKYLIEGEEEVGSSSLQHFLKTDPERLRCDTIVISDGGQFAPGQPAITYGLRGIAYYELRVTGPNRDLHSGSFGGSVTNPANSLCQILASVIDDQGRIQLPGFYDDVAPLSDREREQLAALPFDEAEYLRQVGVEGLSGEAGYSTLERRWARPTFDISGLWGGYQGEGAKTVLPSTAGAKFSFRLVPNQQPEKISAALEQFLSQWRRRLPGIELELADFHGSPAVVVSLDSPYVEAAARAIEKAFGRAPVYTREGGTIPIVSAFRAALGADALLIGWGQDDDNTHSPNERFRLEDFHRGIAASTLLWDELARVKP